MFELAKRYKNKTAGLSVGELAAWEDGFEVARAIFQGDFELYICKCGAEKEISKQDDLEWNTCKTCGRRGCWIKEEDYDKNSNT